jgi:acyl transferase domain-containing protein
MPDHPRRCPERRRTGFVFSGNGSQWPGMGTELLASDRAFRAEAEAVDELMRPRLGWSVLAEMAAPRPARWARTDVAQPLLFTLQAGLVGALAARGIRPAAVTGHSVGEVAAAYRAGALDRDAASRLVVERSRAQQSTAGTGRMAAAGLGTAAAGELAARYDGLAVAAVNSAGSVTLAGPAEALAAARAELVGQGVFCRDLGLEYAFHSPAMDPARDMLLAGLAGLAPARCRTQMISTVTGGIVDGAELDAGYWWRNVREPVRFDRAIDTLTGPGECEVLLEIGPHPVLLGYLRRNVANRTRPVIVVATLSRTNPGPAALDKSVALLKVAKAAISLDARLHGCE